MPLSKRQENALRILKSRLYDAKSDYLDSLDAFIRLYNCEPSQEPFDKWSLWRARFKLARDDLAKTFSRYNRALIYYDNYKKVALGI